MKYYLFEMNGATVACMFFLWLIVTAIFVG